MFHEMFQDFDGVPAVRNGPPSPPADPQHAQLIQLVNRQREKLDSNQELLMRLERDVAALEEQLERRRQEQEYQLGLEATRCEMRCQQQEEEVSGPEIIIKLAFHFTIFFFKKLVTRF